LKAAANRNTYLRLLLTHPNTPRIREGYPLLSLAVLVEAVINEIALDQRRAGDQCSY
jgi:hypothetical protein